ncbi:MAG: efflux RND transporter periplasmic adaptor subunit [Actinomycetota bacterium]|nr:efflux RND transporter periplasmic adaptor subunit [Actinomycetota bacterium]
MYKSKHTVRNYKNSSNFLYYFLTVALVFAGITLTACKNETIDAETVKASRSSISQIVDTTGNVDSAEYKNLSIPSAGKVVKSVKKGDYVKKGEILIEIDDRRTELLISQTEENITIAESSLKMAKLNYQNALDANHIAVQLSKDNNEMASQSVKSALTALENANNIGSASMQTANISLLNAQNSYNQTISQAKTALEQANYQLSTAKNNGLTGIALAQYESAVATAQASYNSTVAAAEASINSAASAINQAEASARSGSENAEEAYNQALISQSLTYWNTLASLEQAESQIKAALESINTANIQVEIAKINLDIAKLDIENMSIKSPFDGIVQNINFTEGEYLSPGIAAITVISNELEIKTNIEESDISKIKPGQKAEITLDAYPGEILSGEVKEVSKISNNLAGVITFPVTIKVAEEKRELLMYGISANITIFISENTDILVVPSISIFEENGKNYVYLYDPSGNEGFTIKEVETGISDFENTEIISGLNEGEEIFLIKPEREKTNMFSR